MIMRYMLLLVCVLAASVGSAQYRYQVCNGPNCRTFTSSIAPSVSGGVYSADGFALAAGEVLVAVNGQPVNQAATTRAYRVYSAPVVMRQPQPYIRTRVGPFGGVWQRVFWR